MKTESSRRSFEPSAKGLRYFHPRALLLAVLLSLLGCGEALSETLSLGIFPYHSAAQLVALHKPLKDYLAREAGLSIHLRSAPDFRTFKQRTAEGRYDLLITAPHLGRLAERQAGYRWLVLTRNQSWAVFVAPRGGMIRSIGDLRGRRLALPPRVAIIHQLALETLEQAGIEPEHDLSVISLATHDRALYAVLQGDADAAAVGRPTWRRYQAPGKETLRVIGRSAPIPGFAIMAHPRVPVEVVSRLRALLLAFPATREGRAYFDSTALEGVRPVSPSDLALLDRYLARIDQARQEKPE